MKQLKFYLDRRFGERGWVHVPNETAVALMSDAKNKYAYLKSLYAQGVKPGFPDILIFKETGYNWEIGMAIEVKREKGGKLKDNQKRWLEHLKSIGWAVAIGRGYQDTINKIEEVYGKEVKE